LSTSVVTFLSQRREAVDEAYAGDIIGFTTHGGVQLGDTITDGASLQYTGLPFFAPELFMTVLLKNPLRTKQLQQGLAQLGEEGAIQVFKPEAGGAILLGAAYLWCAIRFAKRLDVPSAKKLFFASIIYLPLLMAAMMLNKTH